MKKALLVSACVLLGLLAILAIYLLRPLEHEPRPADFQCLALDGGRFEPFTPEATEREPTVIGVGLSYSKHLNETASSFDPASGPPVFRKDARPLAAKSGAVRMPQAEELLAAMEAFEPGLADLAHKARGGRDLPALLDYETELGFVLLEDIPAGRLADPSFAPALGFFLANDLTARTVAIMGEGQPNREDYWGVAKSFPGFLPVADQVWIAKKRPVAGIPCVTLETLVNGQRRQQESTANMIYTPEDMLRAIDKKFPRQPLKRGDLVLMGTPGGVALATPRWLARLSALVGMDRFGKLNAILRRDRSAFLSAGDVVIVRGEGLGAVETRVQGAVAQ